MQWHLEKRNINDLKDHPKNPRQLSKHDAEHLQKSIDKFGLIDKPIINLDNQIIGGHQRKSILKKLGIKQIDCWVPDRELDDKQVEELNIRLNRNTGEFNFDILANSWEIPDLLEYGFDEKELLDKFELPKFEEVEGEEQPDLTDKKKPLALLVGMNFKLAYTTMEVING